VFHGPSEDDDVPDPIFFDLDQDDFVVGNPTGAWSCIPLHLFLDAVALRQHFRTKEREGALGISDLDRLQVIAEGVLYAMQWCRIPIIPLSTDDAELATRTFHRVNSQGVPMTEFHMVAALTWGDTFDLRDRFESEWRERHLPDGWQPAPEQQTLNVLKGLLGMDPVRSPGSLLVRRIRDRPEMAAKPVELLSRAMTIAATHLVHTPVGVPYQLQLTLTAIALHDLQPGADPDWEWLRRWWGLTTVWGTFASAATHRVQAALRNLRAGLAGQKEPWPSLLYCESSPSKLPSLHLRNARARYFADGYAAACDGIDLLQNRGSRAVISLVPGQGTRLGNRFIWPYEYSNLLADELNIGILSSLLSSHFIDEVCLEAWGKNDLDAFFERREGLMNTCESKWFVNLRPEEFIEGI